MSFSSNLLLTSLQGGPDWWPVSSVLRGKASVWRVRLDLSIRTELVAPSEQQHLGKSQFPVCWRRLVILVFQTLIQHIGKYRHSAATSYF